MLSKINWGSLITRQKKRAYQPSRIQSSSYGCNGFRRETKNRVNSLGDGQSCCISVHTKIGGSVNQKKNQVSDEFWKFLIRNGIKITVKYLP